ncbi:MAG TPA: hypothetical protein VK250_00120 [Nitrososphaeraceae archaeon]|nr:hypothetical protein [Nitrososphaeraceae archaeon]
MKSRLTSSNFQYAVQETNLLLLRFSEQDIFRAGSMNKSSPLLQFLATK